jgi:selenide,water dikinase
VLSKAIGTGTVAQALRAGAADAAAVVAATQSMQMLNRNACAAGRRHGVTAATDVTGFGLLGHTHHLAAASGVAVRLRTADVPLLPGALETATAGFLPGGSKRNQRYVAAHLRGADRVDPVILSLLSDAQTSGGLLLVLSDSAAQALVVELGASAAIVGELVAGDAGTIELV